MTPEQQDRYEQKKHQYLSRRAEKAISDLVSNVLCIPPEFIEFLTDQASDKCYEDFSDRIGRSQEIVCGNRSIAISEIHSRIDGLSGFCVFPSGGFGAARSIKIAFDWIKPRLNELLRAQGDGLALMSEDRRFGMRLVTQEGHDDLPYYLEVWDDRVTS